MTVEKLAGYTHIGTFRAGDELQMGDRVKSPCSNGLVMEVVEFVLDDKRKPTGKATFKIIEPEERKFLLQYKGGRFDFPSWQLYRLSNSSGKPEQKEKKRNIT